MAYILNSEIPLLFLHVLLDLETFPLVLMSFSRFAHFSVLAILGADCLSKSVPLSLRAMFDQYFQLGHRLRKHYFSPSVVLCLATGQFLPPLHRKSLYSLQYSMLPAQRAPISEVWNRLTEASPTVTQDPVKVPNGSLSSRRHRPKTH